MATFKAKFTSDMSATFNADFKDDSAFTANFDTSQLIITGDYEKLYNKPSINGVELIGNKTTEDLLIEGDKFYEFSQMTPEARWVINHPLKKYPAITVVDSGGSVVVGDIEYIDALKVIIVFNSAFSGKAFLN